MVGKLNRLKAAALAFAVGAAAAERAIENFNAIFSDRSGDFIRVRNSIPPRHRSAGDRAHKRWKRARRLGGAQSARKARAA